VKATTLFVIILLAPLTVTSHLGGRGPRQ